MTDIQNVNEELQKEPLTESTNVAEPAEETNVAIQEESANEEVATTEEVVSAEEVTEEATEVEADTEELCDKYIDIIYKVIVEKGYKVD